MDVQFLPKLPQGKGFDYKISVIHLATRLKHSEIPDNQEPATVAQVLARAVRRLPPFWVVFTDNHIIFTMKYTAHRLTAFDRQCQALGIAHALIPKGKPWRNGFIERSNRTDKAELFSQRRFADNEERRYYRCGATLSRKPDECRPAGALEPVKNSGITMFRPAICCSKWHFRRGKLTEPAMKNGCFRPV